MVLAVDIFVGVVVLFLDDIVVVGVVVVFVVVKAVVAGLVTSVVIDLVVVFVVDIAVGVVVVVLHNVVADAVVVLVIVIWVVVFVVLSFAFAATEGFAELYGLSSRSYFVEGCVVDQELPLVCSLQLRCSFELGDLNG